MPVDWKHELLKREKYGPIELPPTWGELKLLLKAHGIKDSDRIFMIDIGVGDDINIYRDGVGVEIHSDSVNIEAPDIKIKRHHRSIYDYSKTTK